MHFSLSPQRLSSAARQTGDGKREDEEKLIMEKFKLSYETWNAPIDR